MDPKAFRNKGAFSIAELLIAISLLAVVVLALYSIFSQTQKAFRSSINQVDVNEGGRAAMGILVRDLERAVATGLPIMRW